MEIDPAFRVAGYENFATFHPTFLYESLLNLVLFGALMRLGLNRRLREGSLLFAYLASYGAIRFSVELLRTDTSFRILGLSRNNWVAAFVFLGGVIAFRWWQSRRPFIPMGTPVDAPERARAAERSGAPATSSQTRLHDGGDPEGPDTAGESSSDA